MSRNKTKVKKMNYKGMIYGKNYIIASGSVIVIDDEDIVFNFELGSPIEVTIKFISNNKEAQINVDEMEDEFNKITIRFVNFNSTFGGGSTEPIPVIEFSNGDALFLNAWVTKFDKRTRRFDYTFFWTGEIFEEDSFV